MNLSTKRFHFSPRSTLKAAAVLLVACASVMGSAAGMANAAKPRPRPTPTPASTAVPVPPAAPPAPVSFQVTDPTPDHFAVQMSPATQLGEAELLSGPTIGGPALISVGDGGRLSFLRLAENSDYVFRYRNAVPNGSTTVTSAWVQFSFRTPTFDSLRPSAPQNVRVVERTATTVTVRWDPVPTAARYDVSLNGAAPVQTGVFTCIYCAPSDPLTFTFPRPAPGSNVLFSVTASRAPTAPPSGCGAYCFPDDRFSTSLPATLVVTN